MSLSIGIVGLPNVGKSTLFNTLTNLQVEAANYPFATIEPNVGVVPVPDMRLQKLANLEKSEKIISTVIEFMDIAGLVAGAHKGAGLGNQFLSHIREVDAIIQVVRFFEDDNIIHVNGKVNPQNDMDTIETELILADLQMIEKKLETFEKSAKSGKKAELQKANLAQKYFEVLSKGELSKKIVLHGEEQSYAHEFPLLTNKPILYVANISSNSPSAFSGQGIALDIKLESDISELPENERAEYLKELGIEQSGLDRLITASYQLLDLITFFTAGPKETRAWTVKRGDKAPEAAGKIHTDFQKGFIKADVIPWNKLIESNGWPTARDKGLVRSEGKDYLVQDGDVMIFKFNV